MMVHAAFIASSDETLQFTLLLDVFPEALQQHLTLCVTSSAPQI